jgi:LysM domain
MILGNHAPRLRCLLVWLAATGGLAVCWQVLHPFLAHAWSTAHGGAPAEAPFDRVLADLAALVLLACTAWLWLVTSLVVVEAVRGARFAVTVPACVRRPVLAACGVVLVGGLSQPAFAVPIQLHREDHHHTSSSAHVLDGLPLPDRPVGGVPDRNGPDHPTPDQQAPDRQAGVQHASAAPERRTGPAATVVVVAPGDTLWDIAARRSPGASAHQIAQRWQAIYTANRAVIGDDPDLIEPGQHLVI